MSTHDATIHGHACVGGRRRRVGGRWCCRALPGVVQVGQTYTLYSNTHNVEERSMTFRDGDWDSLK